VKKHKRPRSRNKAPDEPSQQLPRTSGNTGETPAKRSHAGTGVRIAWNVIAGIGLVGGIWMMVTARVSVYPSVSLDPANPVFTVFVIRNDGYLAIRDVKISCSMKYLKLAGEIHAVGLGEYTNRFSDPKQVARVIAPGEEYSVLLPLSGMKHNQVEGADIAVVLSLQPIKWLPRHQERLYRFVVSTGKDGQRHWLHQPIKK